MLAVSGGVFSGCATILRSAASFFLPASLSDSSARVQISWHSPSRPTLPERYLLYRLQRGRHGHIPPFNHPSNSKGLSFQLQVCRPFNKCKMLFHFASIGNYLLMYLKYYKVTFLCRPSRKRVLSERNYSLIARAGTNVYSTGPGIGDLCKLMPGGASSYVFQSWTCFTNSLNDTERVFLLQFGV